MPTIDLHHTKHAEVPRVLEHFIYEHMNKGFSEVTIITGNSTRMKKVVNDILDDYGMTSKGIWGNNGALTVKLK